MPDAFVLAIHGGAGTLSPESMTQSLETAIHSGLRTALIAGYNVLASGGPALDAVVMAVMELEDDPNFNAGVGTVFDADGKQEMDAAVMDGRSRRAGAVLAINGPRNPVQGALAVMEHYTHPTILIGDDALDFCRERGMPFEDEGYFQTERRWRELQARLRRSQAGELAPREGAERQGTVGAVALDSKGGLAAATSAGGTSAKVSRRVGDSPLLGSASWADSHRAISATGDPEHFIRSALAHTVCDRIRSRQMSLAEAADSVVADIGARGGSGGLIAIDASGRVTMPFNARGMYRGTVHGDGVVSTALYREAPLRGKIGATSARAA